MTESAADVARNLVTRLVDEVVNAKRVEAIDAICSPEFARAVHAWIEPFLTSFPDVHMTVVELVVEAAKVAGRFTCSATHLGTWEGHAPTGRRFEDVDEVYFFHVADGYIVDAWGLEDNRSRLAQLGMG